MFTKEEVGRVGIDPELNHFTHKTIKKGEFTVPVTRIWKMKMKK